MEHEIYNTTDVVFHQLIYKVEISYVKYLEMGEKYFEMTIGAKFVFYL